MGRTAPIFFLSCMVSYIRTIYTGWRGRNHDGSRKSNLQKNQCVSGEDSPWNGGFCHLSREYPRTWTGVFWFFQDDPSVVRNSQLCFGHYAPDVSLFQGQRRLSVYGYLRGHYLSELWISLFVQITIGGGKFHDSGQKPMGMCWWMIQPEATASLLKICWKRQK